MKAWMMLMLCVMASLATRGFSQCQYDVSAIGGGPPGLNGAVHAVAVLGNGDVVVGGEFTTAGGVLCNRIARWNGSAWSALGTGLNGAVHAVAVLGNGDVVVGGEFTAAGGAARVHRPLERRGVAGAGHGAERRGARGRGARQRRRGGRRRVHHGRWRDVQPDRAVERFGMVVLRVGDEPRG
jgi:hypothetical protein